MCRSRNKQISHVVISAGRYKPSDDVFSNCLVSRPPPAEGPGGITGYIQTTSASALHTPLRADPQHRPQPTWLSIRIVLEFLLS